MNVKAILLILLIGPQGQTGMTTVDLIDPAKCNIIENALKSGDWNIIQKGEFEFDMKKANILTKCTYTQ